MVGTDGVGRGASLVCARRSQVLGVTSEGRRAVQCPGTSLFFARLVCVWQLENEALEGESMSGVNTNGVEIMVSVDINKLVEGCAEVWSEMTGTPITVFDAHTVDLVSKYIEEVRADDAARGVTVDPWKEYPNLILTLGIILGECIRQGIGGEWLQIDGKNDGENWTVQKGENFKAFPLAKVHKQLCNGAGDDIRGLYFGSLMLSKEAVAASVLQ